MIKQNELPTTSTSIGVRPRVWWLIALLVVALPLGTIVQVWRMLLPPSDCHQPIDATHTGVVVQFCFPALTPQYGQGNITVDQDGNLWFVERQKIGRITSTGKLTEFPTQFVTGPITTGPDGNLWFVGADIQGNGYAIVRMTPDGHAQEFWSSLIDAPSALTVGPDGNLWLGNSAAPSILQITMTGEITPFALPRPNQAPFSFGVIDLVAGADGNLWFLGNAPLTDPPTLQSILLGSITPSGMTKLSPIEIDRGSGPTLGGGIGTLKDALAADSDGNLWFLQHDGQIGRMTSAGVITRFPVSEQTAQEIPILIKGADGNLWFSASAGKIGRITPSGAVQLLPLPAQTQIGGLATGQDGSLWFLNAGDTQIGSVWWVHFGRLIP